MGQKEGFPTPTSPSQEGGKNEIHPFQTPVQNHVQYVPAAKWCVSPCTLHVRYVPRYLCTYCDRKKKNRSVIDRAIVHFFQTQQKVVGGICWVQGGPCRSGPQVLEHRGTASIGYLGVYKVQGGGKTVR